LLFILVGGLFAAAEISLVSLRESQVKGLADRGKRGAHLVRLASDPNRFLAAVQVGVTLAGFLSAAFGAATLADKLWPVFRDWGLSTGLAKVLALIAVTLVISFVSLVLGELAPKRLGLQRAERIAMWSAPTIDRLAVITRPLIVMLSACTNVVVRLLGGDPHAAREPITEEELRGLVATHETLGPDERHLIGEVFTAGERQLREVLVPRTEVDFLDASTPALQALRTVAAGPHSRYPVCRGSHDDVIGFVHIRDLVPAIDGGRGIKVGDLTRPVKMLPDSKMVLAALSEMRRERQHMAIVVDEYGGTAGIVTLEDLVEEVVGDIHDEYDISRPVTRRLLGGAVEVDGLLNLDDFEEETGLKLPDGPYETVAGFVVATLGHLPGRGESVPVDGFRLTVLELDGRRVARVRVSPVPVPVEDESLGQ
jgi:putative hemolysin